MENTPSKVIKSVVNGVVVQRILPNTAILEKIQTLGIEIAKINRDGKALMLKMKLERLTTEALRTTETTEKKGEISSLSGSQCFSGYSAGIRISISEFGIRPPTCSRRSYRIDSVLPRLFDRLP